MARTRRAAPNESPVERSRRRSFWFDPRFVVGIVLIAASVFGVVALVSAADQGVRVYSARTQLSAGDRVTASDLTVTRVRLGQSASHYLAAGAIPSEGAVVIRAVSAGELVPLSSLGDAAGVRVASAVVPVDGELAQSIEAGSVVDVWASAPSTAAGSEESGEFGPPSVLVSSATVVRVIQSQGLVASGAAVSVELLVPRSKIARVIEATVNDDAISLVPVTVPIAKG